jgi:hypothetical protein
MKRGTGLFEKIRGALSLGVLAAGLTLAPGMSDAATLDTVKLGSLLTSDTELDVSSDGTFIEASNFLFGAADLALGAPLTATGEADTAFAFYGDLSYIDSITFDDLLVGKSVDISVDFAADTVSILFSVAGDPNAVNALSIDEFVVGVLNFAPVFDIVELGFVFSDLHFQLADVEVYGASVVPLPAGLPLFLAGLGALGALGARRRTA